MYTLVVMESNHYFSIWRWVCGQHGMDHQIFVALKIVTVTCTCESETYYHKANTTDWGLPRNTVNVIHTSFPPFFFDFCLP